MAEGQVKFRGKTGVIEMGSGNLSIHPWETVIVEAAWVTVQHHDLYETETYLPVFTIRSIRWHDKDMERQGRNQSWEDMHGRYKDDGRQLAERVAGALDAKNTSRDAD